MNTHATLIALIRAAAEQLRIDTSAITLEYTIEFGWDCVAQMPPPRRKRHAIPARSKLGYGGTPKHAVDSMIEDALFSRENGFCG